MKYKNETTQALVDYVKTLGGKRLSWKMYMEFLDNHRKRKNK